MKAAVRDRYGPVADVVEIRELDLPVPADDEVLVRVRAASVNPLDWHEVTGTPFVVRTMNGLRGPKSERLGVDFAGTVEAVGASVERFRPGDEVFGGRSGAFAEYVCVREERAVAPKPDNVTFEQAAAVPVAAITALQGLRDHGRLEPGQRVLVNGGSGGVGTFAVQLARELGATDVTAICSTRNVELVRALGADDAVDYTCEDFTRGDRRYDLMLDVAGSRSWSECKRVLDREATLVMIGAPNGNRLVGGLAHVAKVRLAGIGSGRRITFFIAKLEKPDLELLGDLLGSGKVTPAIDRRYPLDEVGDAIRYVEEGHARGKVVLTLDQ